MSQKSKQDKLALKLILVLMKICYDTDEDALKKYIIYCGRYISDSQFSKILRKAISKMKNNSCSKYTCEDWLMMNLYKIYSSESEIFANVFKDP